MLAGQPVEVRVLSTAPRILKSRNAGASQGLRAPERAPFAISVGISPAIADVARLGANARRCIGHAELCGDQRKPTSLSTSDLSTSVALAVGFVTDN